MMVFISSVIGILFTLFSITATAQVTQIYPPATIEQPVLITDIYHSLSYPDSAFKHHLEGDVLISAYIDIDGSIITFHIDTATNPIFIAPVNKVFSTARCSPAIYRNTPVKAWTTIPIRFALPDTATVSEEVVFMYKEPQGADDISKRVRIPNSFRGSEFSATYLLWIDKRGKCIYVKHPPAIDADLMAAIEKACKNTSFTPAVLNGKPVYSYLSLPINVRVYPQVRH